MAIEREGFEVVMSADVSNLTSGAGKAADALKDTTNQTKDLGDKLDKAKPKLDEHGKALHEGAKHAHLFGHAHHEAHAAVRALGDMLPGVGQLAMEMFSVETLGIGVAALALSSLIEQHEKFHEVLAKNIEAGKQQAEIFRKAHEDAMRQMEAETAAFELKIQHQLDGENAFKAAVEARLRLYDAEADHTLTVAGLEKTRFDQYIDYLVKISALSKGQGLDAKLQEQQAQADFKEGAEERKKEGEIAVKQAELSDAQERQHLGTNDAVQARQQAAKAKEQVDVASGLLASRQEGYKSAEQLATDAMATARQTGARPSEEVLNDWRKTEAENRRLGLGPSTESLIYGTEGNIAAKYNKADDLQASADKLFDAVQAEQAVLDAAKLRQAAADAQVKQFEDEAAEAGKAIHDLTQIIKEKTAELNQTRSDYAQTRQESLRNSAATDFYDTTRHDAESWRNVGIGTPGNRTTAADAISQVSQEFADNQNTGDQNIVLAVLDHIHGILASKAELDAKQTAKLEDMEQKFRQLSIQINANRNSQ